MNRISERDIMNWTWRSSYKLVSLWTDPPSFYKDTLYIRITFNIEQVKNVGNWTFFALPCMGKWEWESRGGLISNLIWKRTGLRTHNSAQRGINTHRLEGPHAIENTLLPHRPTPNRPFSLSLPLRK